MSAPRDVDPLDQAARWIDEGRDVALATVASTWGSAPCPVGSQLAVAATDEFAGSVSGGCVEGAVIGEALACIGGAPARVHEYGVSDERAWSVGLACGGRLAVVVDAPRTPERRELYRALHEARTARRAAALVLDLVRDRRTLVEGPDRVRGDPLAPELVACAQDALATESSALVDEAPGPAFVHVVAPVRRLLVVGAVHIAQVLARMVALVGWEVTVIDPRAAFASPERFPGSACVAGWPEGVLARLAPDSSTAVVALSHDPKIDDPALAAALASPAFYVGALGSRRSHERRLERLREKGIDDAALARIHAPIGLDIGARTPAEIAASILAELVGSRRRGG